MAIKKSIIERFFEKIVRVSCGCWVWIGSSTFGYGTFCGPIGTCTAHRFSWEFHRGPIPEGLHVLHRCDQPSCVNPDHLFLGTHADNMLDMKSKGRAHGAIGQRNNKARLTPSDVIRIRSMKDTHGSVAVAREYGVVHSTITRIWRGVGWKNVR